MEAELVTDGDRARLRLTSVDSDGTPRNFYNTQAGITDPLFVAQNATLEQVAPGVYETELGTLTPGAYAVRLVQTKPGETPLARTVVLVAPTPAEYRLLGTNERLLAALRGATGGRALATGLEAWRHDLGTTTAATDMWPWLLLLALLLWPLDVAVRRVSVARSDLALGRAWVGERWRAWRGPARRPQPVGEMLAAKGRAGGRETRAALLRAERSAGAEQPNTPPAATVQAAAPQPPASAPAAASPPLAAPPTPDAPPEADTMSRLRDAKRRARDRG